MQPKIRLLDEALINRVLDEAFQLIQLPGIKVKSQKARDYLKNAGAKVDEEDEVVHIPQTLAQECIESVPGEFYLHNRAGEPVIQYGGDAVHFDPGSSGVHILDPDTLQHNPSQTSDLIKLIKIAEILSQYDAQSTAVVCTEIPKEIGDLYRLYLILLHSSKPIITGSFSTRTTKFMFEMLSIFSSDKKEMAEKPQAIFDVCPSPPLIWSEFGAQNLIDLAQADVPAQIVSMPLAGAASPVTLIGSIVQHAAECISGIIIHQLARPGARIVWGGAPAIFDMRQGTTPMGAIETAMIDASYAQVGKYLGLPTHTYLGASDSKTIDVQAGLESGMSTLIAALAGINMVSGAGMLDFLACQSPEKLVIDAEIIGMAQRMLEGIHIHTDTLATAMFEGINFKGDFLKQKITSELFSKEQYIPSPIIDRGSIRTWQNEGRQDAFTRSKSFVDDLLKDYQRPTISSDQENQLKDIVKHLSQKAGMEKLPALK